ncbi:hypothetical protein [Acinetobacter sp.]|uniref:hypothetical protein n=1 Tax=Acinetobacter sp. TaxID=472 RepID=UPI00388E4975
MTGTTLGSYGYTYTYSYLTQPTAAPSVSSASPDLPIMIIVTTDENQKEVRMTLAPEADISPSESIKIFMLMTAMTAAPGQFNALAHVKKHQLERHFTYS